MRRLTVGINGFGRIGRAVFRHMLGRDDLKVVAVNDLSNTPEILKYLLQYDSVYGRLENEVELISRAADEKDWTTCEIRVAGKVLNVFSEDRLEGVPWNEMGVEVVVEATGNQHNLRNARKVLGNSVRKVLFTNSPDEYVDFTFVFDVNDFDYMPLEHHIIAGSICDVVGMAPAVRRIEECFGIRNGFITTLHPWLSSQNLLDGRTQAGEFRDRPGIYDESTALVMGRSAIGNLIPKSTSVGYAMGKVLPSVRGKLQTMSYRVPTDVVATGVLNLQLGSPTDTMQVKTLLRETARLPFMGYTEEPLVSVDYKQNSCSSMIDGKWINVLDGTNLRVVSWYDNEWGYSARIVDIVAHLGKEVAK